MLDEACRSAGAEKRPGLSAIASGDGGTLVLLCINERIRLEGRGEKQTITALFYRVSGGEDYNE